MREKIKVAYVMPHAYEYYYPKEVSNFTSPDEFDKKILCYKEDYEDRYCIASLLANIDPTLYYFSNLGKKPSEFMHNKGYKMKKVPVPYKFGRYGAYGWEFPLSMLKDLSNNNFDLVFVFSYALNYLPIIDMYDIIAYKCRKTKMPLIARNGGGTAKFTFRGVPLVYKQLIKKITLNYANKIIVPNINEIKVLQDNFKIDRNKILNILNPIDLSNFYEINKTHAAKKLRKDSSYRYILYVGKLHKLKGLHHLINVFSRLIKLYPDLRLLIVGHGPFEQELRRFVAEKKMQNYVSFEGLIFHDILKYYYNIAEVLVLPSYGEGVPNVLQEAIACKTPCISTCVGGVPDLLSNNIGIIIPPKDETELLRSLIEILDGNFHINEKKRIELLHKWDINSFGYVLRDIYEEILF